MNDKTHEMEEAELLARLKAGDERAAEVFVRAHSGWMLTLARRYLADADLAEDCVQEALLKALRSIGQFEGRSRLRSWLHRIVINAALMRLRSQRRRGERSIEEFLPQFDEFDCRIEAPWVHVATPDEILASRQRRELVMAKIAQLPQKYRNVLLLRDIEELSTGDTAAILGTSEGTVKVRLHRARAVLKKLLEPILKGEV